MPDGVDRSTGIGASELADVLNEGPYGCRRRLVYRRRGTRPDYPDPNVLIMERGNELEDIVARRYAKHTGRTVVRRQPVRHPDYPLIASVDREILGDPRGPGILEVKTHNVNVFRRMKRDGLPSSHILQMAAYLFVRDRVWGEFAVLCPDTWEMMTFPAARDDELVHNILPHVETTFRAIEHGPLPDQLAPDDKRCRRCLYRRTCWGETGLLAALPEHERAVDVERVNDPVLEELFADREDARAAEAEATAVTEAIEQRIKERLGDRQAIEVDGWRVYHRWTKGRQYIDAAGLRAKHPDIAEQFTRVSKESRALRVYAV